MQARPPGEHPRSAPCRGSAAAAPGGGCSPRFPRPMILPLMILSLPPAGSQHGDWNRIGGGRIMGTSRRWVVSWREFGLPQNSCASRCRSKQTKFPQSLPELEPLIGIQFQQPRSGPADGSGTPDKQSVPHEVPGPGIAARIEQSHHPIGVGIHSGKVGSLPFVIPGAGPRQVGRGIRAAVPAGANMLQMKLHQVRHQVWQLAILAPGVGALANGEAECRTHALTRRESADPVWPGRGVG